METTIEIKSIWGSLLFSHISKNNSIKETLKEAVSRDANLRGADLCGADLCGADLCGADLRGANLCDADLRGADLRGANLCGANLYGANLRGADLRGADLRGAYLRKLSALNSILPEGEIVGWKKLHDGLIAKLLIPTKAKRVNAIGSRKCRADRAIVVAVYDGKKKVTSGYGQHDTDFLYKTGIEVLPDKYDPSPLIECSNGIHFFITRIEAEEY